MSEIERFIEAQERKYELALKEVKNGKKNILLDVVYIPSNSRIRY